MKSTASLPLDEEHASLHAAILAVVADGTVLLGTVDTLARALSVTVTELRSALRDLLESRRVTVQMESQGRIFVRLDRQQYRFSDGPI